MGFSNGILKGIIEIGYFVCGFLWGLCAGISNGDFVWGFWWVFRIGFL